MWKTPTKITLVKGDGEGDTFLTAFDRALLNAGIGDFNLIKVSSIVPPGARFVELPDIPKGALVPTVYSKIESAIHGEVISACVGAGVSEEGLGLLYEFSHQGTAAAAEEIVRNMIEEGMAMRGLKLKEVKIVSAEHKVEKIGCAICAAVMWWDE
ncbi:MAG: arginine decarboxylase, pyruvoyl-dependent [Actinobacteria bacterium]|nr:arginine decarboxylase, pyruvoyl-dependent [Actinomycetota bacterium]